MKEKNIPIDTLEIKGWYLNTLISSLFSLDTTCGYYFFTDFQ